MTWRVGIGGFGHETNTYADEVTGPTTLDQFEILHGDALLRLAGQNTCVGGMLDEATAVGVEIVPLYWAYASPSGTIAADAWAEIRAAMIDAVRDAGDLDAVVIELHGAAVGEGNDDLEGDLGAALREVIGNIPLVAAADLHGNVSDAMAAHYDALFGCHLYPHTDLGERGREALRLAVRLLAQPTGLTTHVEHVPVLLPTSATTPGQPAAAMNELCAQIEARPGVVDCTVFHGFPYTDTKLAGAHVVVTTEGDAAAARAAGREVGRWIWDNRESFRHESLTSEAAVLLAAQSFEKQADSGPVIINETSDNPGGGSPGDGTHLLRAMLDAKLTNACFAFVADSETVRHAIAAGVGATTPMRLGGKHGTMHGEPIEADAYVHSIADGRITLSGPMLTGVELRLGPSVRLRIGGVDVVVTSVPWQTMDEEIFRLHGIDVRRHRVVGLKSSQHFRAGFGDIASRIITADAPGLTSQRVEGFARRHAAGPLWPLNADAVY